MERSNIFIRDYGVFIALDFPNMDDAKMVVDISSGIEGVVGYKDGMMLMFNNGLYNMVGEIGKYTELPQIYDHQKRLMLSDDEEDPYGEKYAGMLKKAGFDGGILFASINPYAQRMYIENFFRKNLIPFIVARGTWDGILQSEGGIVPDDVPGKNYIDAARQRVEYFVMPANRPDEVRNFVKLVLENLPEGKTPKICLPGHGSQKGNIRDAFKATSGLPSYGIIGPVDCIDMTNRQTIRDSIKKYCDEALEFEAGI